MPWVSDANQQVSKVEDEGDDNRDEGSASAEQDEVGCKHLMERRGLQDILDLQHASFALRKGCFFWSIMNYEAHRIEGVDNISSDNPLTR